MRNYQTTQNTVSKEEEGSQNRELPAPSTVRMYRFSQGVFLSLQPGMVQILNYS
jgi:hypothetical protein